MKNLLFIALIGITLFSSCKKDPTADELILGTWDLTSFVIDGDDLVGESSFAIDEVGIDGTVTTYSETVVGSGTLTFGANNAITLTMREEITPDGGATTVDTETSVGIYSLDADGTTLTLNFAVDEIVMTGTVITLEEKAFNYNGTLTYDNDPTDTEAFLVSGTKN